MNTKQYKLLKEINHNVLAIGNFLIESLTLKRKKVEVAPRVKRKKTLAEMIVQVLRGSNQSISYTLLRKEVRNLLYSYDDKLFTPSLRKLLKKGVIKMKKSSGKHLYSIAQKPRRKAA